MADAKGVLGEVNQKWITTALTILVSAATSIGAMLYNSQQKQIEQLQDRVYEQQRVTVTENKLNREIERVIQIVDLKLSSIETAQREIGKQLAVMGDQQREFQKEVRKRLNEAGD